MQCSVARGSHSTPAAERLHFLFSTPTVPVQCPFHSAAPPCAPPHRTPPVMHPERDLPSHLSARRYLILTYCAEFDRVHYPLPLMVDEAPTSDAMKQTIKRLRCAENPRLPPPAVRWIA